MALLNVDLLSNLEVIVDSSNADDIGNIINITALGSGALTIDGVDAKIGSIAGIKVGAVAAFNAQNGGSLTIDQGLLNVSALTATVIGVGDSSTVNLNASTIDLGLVNNILNQSTTINFTGDSHTGHFNYTPPTIAVASGLSPITFNTTGMAATDTFTVADEKLKLDTTFLGGADSAYRDGALHLTTGSGSLLGLLPGLISPTVNVVVPMTQAEYNLFKANQALYMSGGTFTFPGTLPVPCFAAGTLILTAAGEIAIEDLRAGDLVWTKDNGFQAIAWIGARHLSSKALATMPENHPIRICKDALGEGFPKVDLLVSPQHRVLVSSKIAKRMFGAEEVLVAAKSLLHIEGVEVASDLDCVAYHHMLFSRHEVVYSNGAETESLFTGPVALKAVGKAATEEIFAIFPELRDMQVPSLPVRPLLEGADAKKLAIRHANQNASVCAAH